MQLPAPLVWSDGFTQNTTGDGVLTITGKVASLSSGIDTGAAYLQKRIQSTPGEVLTVRIMARQVSGEAETAGQLKVEWPEDGTGSGSVVYIDSPEWREYEVSVGASYADGSQDYFDIAIGVFTAGGGEIQVAYPRFTLEQSRKGGLRVHAYGLLHCTAGVVTLDPDFVQSGISAIAYDVPSKTITLTTPKGITGITAGAAPLMFAQITTDAATQYIAKVGAYSRGTGTVQVKVYDMLTGAPVDITGIAGTFYISLLMAV